MFVSHSISFFMTSENPDPAPQRSGCFPILLIIGSSMVATGILYFGGRWLFGGTGAYFLFYGLLLTGILGLILGYFIKKRRKEEH